MKITRIIQVTGGALLNNEMMLANMHAADHITFKVSKLLKVGAFSFRARGETPPMASSAAPTNLTLMVSAV